MPAKKKLPNLTYEYVKGDETGLLRRRMAKLCGDQAARIFLSVIDPSQTMAHHGVLLRGREIFGWLVRTNSGRRYGAKAGEVFYVSMDWILPSPAFQAHLATLGRPHLCRGGGPGSLAALRTIMTRRDTDDGEAEDTLWSPDFCADLTTSLGLVELFSHKRQWTDFQSEGVLVPDTDDNWVLQGRKRVEQQALDELRPKAWWTLPQTQRTVTVDAPDLCADGERYLEIAVRHLADTPGILLAPGEVWDYVMPRATEFCFEARPQRMAQPMLVLAKRAYQPSLHWSVEIKVASGALLAFASYSGLCDASMVAQLAIETCRRGGDLPPADVFTERSEALALEQQSWAQLAAKTQEAHRRLRFVIDAITAAQNGDAGVNSHSGDVS